MIKKYTDFLKEEYLQGNFKDSTGSEYKIYQLLYYAFDWDDNILKMPTEIILLDNSGKEIGMSTQDFAEYRDIIGKQEFDYNGQTIVGYASDAFRYFRDERDENIFTKDVKKALENGMTAKSYNDFIECLTTGALFAIITARGHESGPMRKGVEYIISKLEPKQKKSMIDHLKMFSHLFDEAISSDDQLIKNYLDLCEFIGVSSPSKGGKPDNPEKAKEDVFWSFVNKCDNEAKRLEGIFNSDPETIKSGIKWKVIAKVGFSDDDRKNVKHMNDAVQKNLLISDLTNPKNIENIYSHVKEFYIIDTGKEEVETNIYKKYQKDETESTSESVVRKFDKFLKKKITR